ncbi:uncharacterized protein LOC112048540 [Bicyclus anynana]|uniref:Uncharacterized protein LOC112048540 n=1 Tax=Bicyclus anynana TaxID=110368 RepID=A0A6J1NA46_BICAN|nr:uncharacterized protein LOC112048540 [Bicyclus anynana]
MPALWQSSQHPMYIRTVWVDGFRHAILTQDDPHFLKLAAKRRRPSSTASYAKSATNRSIISSLSHHEDLGECLRNLNLAIRSSRYTNTAESKPHIEKLDLCDVENSEDEIIVKTPPQPVCHLNNFRFDLEADNMRTVKSNRTARNDVKESTELSDRVLQWLDLAGKVNLLTVNNVERMSQPRHSWPEIQRRNLTKSKTATELRAREVKVDGKISGPIDRQEYYMPTSANTIENYARQSRNVKCTPRHDIKLKENKKVKDMRASVMETRQKMVSERNAMEKQYAEMVSKKLLPDVGKTKKQVHIFMPEALTKKFASNTSSIAESLLSQKCNLSSVNQAAK